jgi:hypothetical protein
MDARLCRSRPVILFVDDVDCCFRQRTSDVEDRLVEGRRAQADARIVGESEALLGPTKDIPVELHVLVFVMQRHYSVVSRRDSRNGNGRFARTSLDRARLVTIRLCHVLGPSVGRVEEQNADHAVGIAQTLGVNLDRALLRTAFGGRGRRKGIGQ